MKAGKIITLFHAVFQVWHINSHIRYGHINLHRSLYVCALYGWVERSCCFISQVVPGQTACVQHFSTHRFPLHSSVCFLLSSHCIFTSVCLQSLEASSYFLLVSLLMFFFPLPFSFLLISLFMVSVTAPPWSFWLYIVLLPLFLL